MPNMNGMEATREIRKLSQNGLKIIGLTAYIVPGIKEECLDAGMNDCIAKPLRMSELGEILKKYAENQ